MIAILCNEVIQTCDEKTFLLPSAIPQESLANYSVHLDITTGIVHVASRFRYVTLKELFLLRKATSPAYSTPFVEFSNGEVLAVPLYAGTCNYERKDIVQDAFQAQGSTDRSTVQQKRSEISSGSMAVDNVFNKACKPFQEKGAGLTSDALASMQQNNRESATQSSSPSSGSRIGMETTPATSTTSSNFSSPLHSPEITVPDKKALSKASVHAPAGDGAPLPMMQVIRSAVQDLPSFPIDTKSVSLCYEALDLGRSICQKNLNDPLAALDLAPSELKEAAYAVQKKFTLASPDSPDVEIALDEISGDLYLQSIPFKCQSLSSFDMIDMDAIFGDDDDFNVSPGHLTGKLSTAAPVHTCMTLEESKALNTLSLRQTLPESTIQVLDRVNIYYRDIWLERYKKRNGTLEKDQSKYYEATYDEALQEQAVVQFEANNFTIPKDILQLVQPFIVNFLQIWCEGPGGRPNKPDGHWILGADEPMVNDMTVKLVEWQQVVNSSKQTQLVQLRPGTVAIQEASSPSDWYLQALGGDGQYCEHRRVEVDDSDGDESGFGEEPVHHINFNGNNIYQRSYTPPEVSFWAAATTYDKVLVQKLSLPPKDKNVCPKSLPAVHVARVLAAQAFKWVDPTQYSGHDIYALWKKKGSAMRNAATSNVNVVYQQVGTWNSDRFTEDDVMPKIAPNDLNYEYATNGNYQYLQLPYHVYDSSDEHCMIELNVGKQPKHHFHSYTTQIRSPTSLLQYELGAELAKKAALLEDRMEKRSSLRKSIKFMENITEEASTVEEDADIADETNISTAAVNVQDRGAHDRVLYNPMNSSEEVKESASADDEDVVVRQAENASDASTDVGEEIDLDREPVDFVESSGKDEEDTPTIGEERMFHAEDDSSEAATVVQLAPDLNQEPKVLHLAMDVELTVPALEDGRYLSPSKMVPSRIDLARTPPQSPAKAVDHGSWELDLAGNFVSPRKSESSTGLLTEDEDDMESILNLIEDKVNPMFSNTAKSSHIVQYQSVQLIGKPFDGDDVFGLGAVHNAVDFTAGNGRQATRLQIGVSSHLGEPDVDAEINETYAAIAEKRSWQLRSRVLTEAWDDVNAPDVEEEESSDGDNEIIDDQSTWSGRPDRASRPKGDVLSGLSKRDTSLCIEDSEVDRSTRLFDTKKTRLVKCSGPQEHPKAAFLAQFADKAPTRKSNRSLLSLIEDGETLIPSTNPGDLALGPEYPNLAVGDRAPADFNDPLIDDVLGITDLDAEGAAGSPHHVMTDDITAAALSEVGNRQRSQGTASDTASVTPGCKAFSSRTWNLVSTLSPIRAGDREDESTPIKARKPVVKSKVRRTSQAAKAFRDRRSCRVLNTQPDLTDEESEEILLERVAQQEKKRSGMTVMYEMETAEHCVSSEGNSLIQTDCTTSTKHHEDTQKSGEESSPNASRYQSRDSSKQSSGQTSPSSLDDEDLMFMEHQPNSLKMPGKLDIDERSPTWRPLVNCWKHIAVAVIGIPQKNADLEITMTPPLGTPSRVVQGAPRARKKIGEMQWIKSTDLKVVPANGDVVRATNPPNQSSRLAPDYGQIAIAVGSAAIELATWLFWKCI